MSIPESNRRRLVAAAVLACLVALPAASQEAAEAPIVAAMRTAPGSITWEPLVGYEKLTLTVQGGGYISTRELAGGSVYFAPVDPEGFQLPDGTYSWEIRLVRPALEFNSILIRSDQMLDNGRAQRLGIGPEPLVQSGSFTIANGAIVDPGLTEPRSAVAAPGAAAAADIDDSDDANP